MSSNSVKPSAKTTKKPSDNTTNKTIPTNSPNQTSRKTPLNPKETASLKHNLNPFLHRLFEHNQALIKILKLDIQLMSNRALFKNKPTLKFIKKKK